MQPAKSLTLYHTETIRTIEQRYSTDASPRLMERAGAAAAEIAWEILGKEPSRVLVVAGPGNNGGDGFVLARLLKARGCDVTVAFAGKTDHLPADAAQAILDWGEAGGDVRTEWPMGDYALAVDALFGIGLTRPIDGLFRTWVDQMNNLDCPILALDVPSGLDADTGRAWGRAVRASHTATFIAAKPGLFTLDGPDHAGEISVHGLDLDLNIVPCPAGQILELDHFSGQLHPRARNSHKGTNGSAGIIGGASGMLGAALLAGRAALMLGAGRVFLGLLDPLPVDPTQPELMLRRAHDILEAKICTVLACGPGLGQSEAAAEILARALGQPVPLLLDADALNLLAMDPARGRQVADRRHTTLLTPHPAEAARLLAVAPEEVQADRIKAAREIARRFHAVTVLKGCGSVVAAPDGQWWINTTGNPGMGTAGMGDVLSGLALALLSQGWRGETALLAAVHLHGLAADACAAVGKGPVGLTAGETIPVAREIFNRWTASHG